MTHFTQGTQKTDNRTDSRNSDSQKKTVTTHWMEKRGLSANNAQFVSVDLMGEKESSHIRILNTHISTSVTT